MTCRSICLVQRGDVQRLDSSGHGIKPTTGFRALHSLQALGPCSVDIQSVWTLWCGPYIVDPTVTVWTYSVDPTGWSLQCGPYSVDPTGTVWTLQCGPYGVDPTVWTLQRGPYSVDRGEVELELLFWGHTLLSAIPHAVTQTTSILMPFCMWQPRWQAS